MNPMTMAKEAIEHLAAIRRLLQQLVDQEARRG